MAAFFCLINLKAPQKILECVILNLPVGRRVYFKISFTDKQITRRT